MLNYYQKFRTELLKSEFYNSFSDSELLELLCSTMLLKDQPKAIASDLLSRFGNLYNLITADAVTLVMTEPIYEPIVIFILLIREVQLRILKHEFAHANNIINSSSTLIKYLTYSMKHLKVECFRVLFLNKMNRLIEDKIMSTGTVDQVHVYPQEIVRHALMRYASAIILVHNHPGRSVIPSDNDIVLTKKIVQVCKLLNIKVHDHIIITHDNFFSFRDFNMLKMY